MSPTLMICIGVLAGTNLPSFFVGMIAYSFSLTFLSVTALATLVGTLVTIRHNSMSASELNNLWPPVHQADEKRCSFAQEDFDHL